MFNMKYEDKLTIVVPCYNEENTIVEILRRIEKISYIKKQIIVVDDASKDNSRDLIRNFKFTSEYKLIFHDQNKGKGACIKSSQEFIEGDIVLIQDADLEYNPENFPDLIDPIINNKSNVVYGSRVLGKKKYKDIQYSRNYLVVGNRLLTLFSNLINNQHLTDAHTCYKVFRFSTFKKIFLVENGFAFCPEITTKLSNLNEKIIEIPIEYKGRSYKEGKKVKFLDGLEAIMSIIKYKLFK